MQKPALRSDAAENRERLIASAREVFQHQGIDAPLEAIAGGAGVSRATLYRHFATRDELVASVFSHSVDQIEARALEMAADDRAAEVLFQDVLRMQLADRGLAHVLAGPHRGELQALGNRVELAFRPLVDRAVAGARVRADMQLSDIMLCFSMAAGAVRDDPAPDRAAQARMATLLRRALFPVD